MTSRILLLAMLGAALPGTLPAQDARSDSVSLTFGWPVGLEASVTHVRLQVQSAGGAPESTGVRATWRMRVREHTAGREVDYYDFKLPGLADAGGGAQAPFSVEAIGAAAAPSIVVSTEGGLVALADPDGFAATMRAMIQPLFDRTPARAEGVRAFLQRLLDPAVLSQQATNDWTGLVGAWAGATMHRGVPLELKSDEVMPMFPGRPIPYFTYFEFVSREPCSAEARDSACVALEMTSIPDTAAVARLIASVLDEVTRGGIRADSIPIVRRADMEYRVRVVTEPRGLVPHELVMRQRVSMAVESRAEGSVQVSQERVRTFRYAYVPPR